MNPARALRFLLSYLPLLGLAAAAGELRANPPFLFACLAAYGRLAAFVNGYRGGEEALLFAGLLPFAAWGAVFTAELAPVEACLFLAATLAGAGALLVVEDFASPRRGGFGLALAFCATAALLALLLGSFGPASVVALSLPVATLFAYLARRRRP